MIAPEDTVNKHVVAVRTGHGCPLEKLPSPGVETEPLPTDDVVRVCWSMANIAVTEVFAAKVTVVLAEVALATGPVQPTK